jgi:hypothetical protein
VLGLVAARALEQVGRNRQVVAYGYDDDGAGPGGGPPIRLFIYDSHHPDTEVVLALEAGGQLCEASAGDDAWRGLFLQDYARERPPYIDLGAAKGIWVNSWTPTLGGNFVAQFTARNYGEYRAHLSELRLAVRGPAGENLDRFLGGDGDPTPLEPGEERAVFKASDGFGTVAGSYAVAAGYLSEQGCWLTIPPGEPGAVDEVGVTVIPPPRRSRSRSPSAGSPSRTPTPSAAGWPCAWPSATRRPAGRRRGRPTSRTASGSTSTSASTWSSTPARCWRWPSTARPPTVPRRRGPRPLPRPGRLGRRRAHLPQPPGSRRRRRPLDGRARHRGHPPGRLSRGRPGRPMIRRLVASAAEVGRAVRVATIRRLRAGTT